MGKKLTEIDRAIAGQEAKIRECQSVIEAFKALQDAKRKLRKPRPLTVAEMKAGA